MRIIIVLLISCCLFFNFSYAQEKIVIEGSTTVAPIAKAFAKSFQKINPNVEFVINATGSGDGAKALINKKCQIANMSRFLKKEELAAAEEKGVSPVAFIIAMDGLSIVAHPDNPINNLSLDQIKQIYKGQIKNWKELGGNNLEIVIINREKGSGTFDTFNSIVMKNDPINAKHEVAETNMKVKQMIRQNPGAIGYIGLGQIDNTVKNLEVDGISPDFKTVRERVYPISRPLYMITNGTPKPGSAIYAYVTYYLTKEAHKIVLEAGFVPITTY